MRLAVFTNQYPSKVSTFFVRDMAALAAAGVEVSVFPLYPLDASLWKYVPGNLPVRLTDSDAVHHLSFGGALMDTFGSMHTLKAAVPPLRAALSSGVSASVRTAYTIPKAVAWAKRFDGKFDHVLAYWSNYSATCAFLFRRAMTRHIPLSMIVHAGIDLYYNRTFLREKLLDADNIFVVCNFNKEHLREIYPDDWAMIEPKIVIHHPGLDFSELAYHCDERPPGSLITVGRLIRLKGLDYLLRALRILVDKGMTLTLDIVGDGEEQPALRRLVASLGLSHVVRFRGWMVWSDVRKALSASTALIHPSVRFGDAVPTVIKESLAIGTPVIASEVGGIPELLDFGRCGALVPPENVAALATVMEEVLANPQRLRRYSTDGRRFAEHNFNQWTNGVRMAEHLRAPALARQAVAQWDGR